MSIMLRNVRLSFPCLWETETYNGVDTEKFAATFLIAKDSPDAKAIQKAVLNAAEEKFGKPLPKGLKYCLMDGDEKETDGYAGHWYVKATTKRRPHVIDRDRTPLVEEDGKPYAGCYVNAMISLWVMDNQYGKRVLANLEGIQFAKDGEPFGNNNTASVLAAFEDISDEVSDEVETADNPFA